MVSLWLAVLVVFSLVFATAVHHIRVHTGFFEEERYRILIAATHHQRLIFVYLLGVLLASLPAAAAAYNLLGFPGFMGMVVLWGLLIWVLALPVIKPKTPYIPFLSHLILNLINRLWPLHQTSKPTASLEEELELVFEGMASDDPAEDQKIYQEILRFSDLRVADIMTPKSEIVSIRISDTLAEVLATITNQGFSRMPVFNDQGALLGSVHSKDLLHWIDHTDAFWQRAIRPIIQVDEHRKIIELLQEFKAKRSHLAMVKSHQGMWVGLVTLEDVVEEIVGEIADEFDEPTPLLLKVDSRSYLVDPRKKLGDIVQQEPLFEGRFGEAAPSTSLHDFLIDLFQRIPSRKERSTSNGVLYTIEAADNKRIIRVKMTVTTI